MTSWHLLVWAVELYKWEEGEKCQVLVVSYVSWWAHVFLQSHGFAPHRWTPTCSSAWFHPLTAAVFINSPGTSITFLEGIHLTETHQELDPAGSDLPRWVLSIILSMTHVISHAVLTFQVVNHVDPPEITRASDVQVELVGKWGWKLTLTTLCVVLFIFTLRSVGSEITPDGIFLFLLRTRAVEISFFFSFDMEHE